MEDNKRGKRPRISKADYSTSRSFSDGDRPARRNGAPQQGERRGAGRNSERTPYGERREGGRPERSSYGERRSGGTSARSGYSKPGSSRSGSGYGKPYKKRDGAKEGMDAMLRRKPQVNGRYSDNDSAPTEIKEVVRLNKFYVLGKELDPKGLFHIKNMDEFWQNQIDGYSDEQAQGLCHHRQRPPR